MEMVVKVLKFKWKVLVLSLVAQFVITALVSIGTKPPEIFQSLNLVEIRKSLTSPQPETDVFQLVTPRLEQKKNDFRLIRGGSSVVSTAYASSMADQAAGYIVVDLDSGKVLAEKDGFKSLPIASITKVMTAMVALDLASNEETFVVSSRASKAIPSKVMLKTNEKVSLNLLLHSLLLASANDAAMAIADGIDQKYGQSVFIKAMNEKAKLLGLESSHFTNPAGLDNPEHLSSAADVAVFSAYALKNYPQIAQIVAKSFYEFKDPTGEDRFKLRNWNGLLGVYPGVWGIKIGNTSDAGKTTTIVSAREGKQVLAVILGAKEVLQRDLWAAEVLNIGFEKLGIKSFKVTEKALKDKYSSWAIL